MDAEWIDGAFLDELSYSKTHVHGECSLLLVLTSASLLHCFLCSISLSIEWVLDLLVCVLTVLAFI